MLIVGIWLAKRLSHLLLGLHQRDGPGRRYGNRHRLHVGQRVLGRACGRRRVQDPGPPDARRGKAACYRLSVAVTGSGRKASLSDVQAAIAAAAPTSAVPAKWDASGSVKFSTGSDASYRMCGFRVVRNLPKKSAEIRIGNATNGWTDYRYLRHADNVFASNDRSRLVWQRKDESWWVSVNAREFHFILDALIHGG